MIGIAQSKIEVFHMKDEKQHVNNSFTVAGTNIEEVKALNMNFGMSYNEAKFWLAMANGGRGTRIFSNTDITAMRRKFASEYEFK